MDAQRPRLLVVDDDRAILSLIGSVALAEGFEVATTDDAADALMHLLNRPADLVLLDLRMPGVTGFDVLRSIRDVNSRCKVVLMTGFGTIENAVEAVKLGATDYLTKPFDLARMRQLLRDVRSEADQRRLRHGSQGNPGLRGGEGAVRRGGEGQLQRGGAGKLLGDGGRPGLCAPTVRLEPQGGAQGGSELRRADTLQRAALAAACRRRGLGCLSRVTFGKYAVKTLGF